MVTLDIVNSLRTACDLLERGRITTLNVKGYAEIWLVNVKGWTPEQEAHLIALANQNITQPLAMATMNMLAAEVTYQHARHIWETVRKW